MAMRRNSAVISTFHEMVLIAVQSLDDPSMSELLRQLEESTGVQYHQGSMYMTLTRLIDKGFVESIPGEKKEDKKAKERVFYKITNKGVKELNNSELVRRKLRDAA